VGRRLWEGHHLERRRRGNPKIFNLERERAIPNELFVVDFAYILIA